MNSKTASDQAAFVPIVAIVGRPNVGKSSLFNRVVGQRVALIEEEPGTTRDRLYGEAEWGGRQFLLVDTGGLQPESASEYAPLIRAQVEQALAEADVIVFVVDARDGLTAADWEVADLLRRATVPVLLAANKVDNEARRLEATQFYELGLGDPMPISAYHGRGVADLLDRVVDLLPPAPPLEPAAEEIPVAIVGRPNVGKSQLVNAILGQPRVIVSETPGTTRDAIDTPFQYGEHRLRLIDTAGIRRRGRIEQGVERHSVLRARDALERAEVAVLVVDAMEPFTAQDSHIAGYAISAYRGLVIAVNKWDLIEDSAEARDAYLRAVRHHLRFATWAPACFISAKEGTGIDKLLDLVIAAWEARQTRVSTGRLNVAIREAIARHPPPTRGGRRVNILYVTQTQVAPPTFTFFVSDPDLIHFSYRRFLENSLRKAFDFEGTAIKLVFRGRRQQRE